jgi:hypothetical protein
MSCPLFSDARGCRCRAVAGHHVPTLFERERYCKSGPADCPTLTVHLRLGRVLTDEEYLQIWVPGAVA